MRVNMTTAVANIMEEVEEEIAERQSHIERVKKFAESGPLKMPKSDLGPLLVSEKNSAKKVNISI